MRLSKVPTVPLSLLREYSTRSVEARVPEPMVMDDADSVAEYHEVGKKTQAAIYQLSALATSHLAPEGAHVLDLGSGSGQNLAHLARRRPDLRITGVDLSDLMIETAEAMFAEEGLDDRVKMVQGDITDLADLVPDDLGVVSSVQSLHHLPSFDHLQRCLEQMAAARERTGCAVWIFDEARLRHGKSYGGFMETAFNFPLPPKLKHDALASERAAFTPAEMVEYLGRAGLGDLHGSAMYVLPAFHLYWPRRRDGAPSGHERCWRAVPPLPGTAIDTFMFGWMFPDVPHREGSSLAAVARRGPRSV
ncbi:MAG TPA: class I SAM-dependent methyltransferase [Thermoleophilaceae bacterium]